MRTQKPPNCCGFTLVELLVAVAIICIIIAIAFPNLKNVYRDANETAVKRQLQTIFAAQLQYQSQFGRYAATLAELGPPSGGPNGPSGAHLIPASLASGKKNGYVFTMTLRPEGFAVNANPASFGAAGGRTFYIDENGVVHYNWGSTPATAESPEIQ